MLNQSKGISAFVPKKVTIETKPWKCFCGRNNIPEARICECGAEKETVEQFFRNTNNEWPEFMPGKEEWLCTCGRKLSLNQMHCECGANAATAAIFWDMGDLYSPNSQTPKENRRVWLCTCGAMNPMCKDTCSCGVSQQEAEEPIKEMLRDYWEERDGWECFCGRMNMSENEICGKCGSLKQDVLAMKEFDMSEAFRTSPFGQTDEER